MLQQTAGVRSTVRSAGRRVPRRWILVVVAVLAVGASERWDGPVTMEVVARSTTRLAEAAGSRLSPGPSPGSAGEIHLTFDDGPHLTYTPQVLDVLAAHDAAAVFYPIGNQVPDGAALLRRAVAEGHRIGNHTWDHDMLRGIDETGFALAVDRTQDAIGRELGAPARCLRPPGGALDGAVEARAAARGMSITLWTVDPSDWRRPGASAIADRVLAEAGDGDVVLLHDGGGDRSQTVAALDEILDELSGRGYRFTPVPGC